ncbi:hypothetical protein ACFQHO_29040 [Actinomadura yumaensis]|uniref:hypothetical protein n=1 Tax=Actinomadura yumaensis TaxID=111807 RepID=UPI00361390A2
MGAAGRPRRASRAGGVRAPDDAPGPARRPERRQRLLDAVVRDGLLPAGHGAVRRRGAGNGAGAGTSLGFAAGAAAIGFALPTGLVSGHWPGYTVVVGVAAMAGACSR